MSKLRVTDWGQLLTLAPVNKQAALAATVGYDSGLGPELKRVKKMDNSVHASPEFVDLTGHVFGKLTVIGYLESKKGHSARWLVRCACGAQQQQTSRALKKGKAVECSECSRRAYNSLRYSAVNRRWRHDGKEPH